MRTRAVLCRSLTIAAIGLFVACGDPFPTTPSQLNPKASVSIEVVGPDWLLASQSAQFVANIRQTDGTTKSATSMPNLRWLSSNTSVMSVSASGVVTATAEGFGEAVISADITPSGRVRGTREVVVKRKAAVTGTFEVSQAGAEPNVPYVFDVKLTESAGVSATVTAVWITFDDGWGGQCSWTPDKLSQTRLPANGTLALNSLACSDGGKALSVDIAIDLKDDNGYLTQVFLFSRSAAD